MNDTDTEGALLIWTVTDVICFPHSLSFVEGVDGGGWVRGMQSIKTLSDNIFMQRHLIDIHLLIYCPYQEIIF